MLETTIKNTKTNNPKAQATANKAICSKAWLTQRFNLSPPYQYEPIMTQRVEHELKARKQNLRSAAVMIALVERNHELFVLLTKRAEHLNHHPGQISFPGGKVEPFDLDVNAAAIREMQEEIGVSMQTTHLLGQLASLPTISGYLVTPVVGFVAENYKAKLDHNEVESLFEIPLAHFMQPNAITQQSINIKGHEYPIYACTYKNHFIWGVTALILFAFNKQLNQGTNETLY